MIVLSIDKKIPLDLENLIKTKDYGFDFAAHISTSPVFLILCIDAPTQREIKATSLGEFSIGVSTIDSVPIVTLDYGQDFCFDFCFESIETSESEFNAFNIILIDRNDYIVKSIRMIGMSVDLMAQLQSSIKSIPFKGDAFVCAANSIYSKYTTSQIHKLAKKQYFKGVT